MKSKAILYLSGLVGFISGIFSTYPIELKFLIGIIFWGVVGVVLGLFVEGQRETILSGALYGIFLSIGFLFSRFVIGPHVLSGILFVVLAFIGTIFGSIMTVFVGSMLRRWSKKEQTR